MVMCQFTIKMSLQIFEEPSRLRPSSCGLIKNAETPLLENAINRFTSSSGIRVGIERNHQLRIFKKEAKT